MKEKAQEVHFYVSDVRESMEATHINGLTKAEIAKQLQVWQNSIQIAESVLNEMIK